MENDVLDEKEILEKLMEVLQKEETLTSLCQQFNISEFKLFGYIKVLM